MTTQTPHLPLSLKLFCVLSVGFTIFSLSFALLQANGFIAQGGLSTLWMDTPTFDFYVYDNRLRFIHTGRFFSIPEYPWYYPAPAVFLYEFFHRLSLRLGINVAYQVYLLVSLAGAACGLTSLATHLHPYLTLRPRLVFLGSVMVTCWPIYFSLQRGNMESLLWLFLAAAVALMTRERWFSAAVVLGITAGVKLYPLLVLGIFLARKKYAAAALAASVALLETLAALRLIDSRIGYAFIQTKDMVASWTNQYALSGFKANAGFDHSIFELVKTICWKVPLTEPQLWHIALPILAISAAGIFFSRISHLPLINQLLFVLCLCVSLPPASFDYTLQSLYIPFAWVVFLIASERLRRGALLLMGAFSVVLAPVTFLIVGHTIVAGLAKCLGILTLLTLSVVVPLDQEESSMTNPQQLSL